MDVGDVLLAVNFKAKESSGTTKCCLTLEEFFGRIPRIVDLKERDDDVACDTNKQCKDVEGWLLQMLIIMASLERKGLELCDEVVGFVECCC